MRHAASEVAVEKRSLFRRIQRGVPGENILPRDRWARLASRRQAPECRSRLKRDVNSGKQFKLPHCPMWMGATEVLSPWGIGRDHCRRRMLPRQLGGGLAYSGEFWSVTADDTGLGASLSTLSNQAVYKLGSWTTGEQSRPGLPPEVVAAKSHRFLFGGKLGNSTKHEVPIIHWMAGFHLAEPCC